jgi:hypothetical protein
VKREQRRKAERAEEPHFLPAALWEKERGDVCTLLEDERALGMSSERGMSQQSIGLRSL